MKNHILAILLFLNFWCVFAQDNNPKISLSFQNYSVEDVLKSIEEKINYRFYFVLDWLKGTSVSGSYENASVDEILTDIFNETLINYYIAKDGRVILTKNNIIYDALPDGFFGNTTQGTISENNNEEEESISAPVFFNEATTTQRTPVETIRIGKEDKNSNRKRFTLSGTVKNAVNGAPVPNLALVVQGKKIGTVTDTNGAFRIELPAGLNVIETQSLGFETALKRVIIYNDGRLDVTLNESYEGLKEVVIDADADKNVEDTNIGSTQIDVGEMKNIPLVLGERDIFKVATALPGITNVGEGAAGYNVRGGKTDQNLILLDDAVIYNPAHFFGIFSAINPFTSDEVTIYKGNIPARFGGRLSSVFDIRTKDANIEKFSGEASIGPVTSNLVLEMPLVKGKSGLLLGGRSTYSNWILRSLDEKELQKSKASFFDIIAKYNTKIDNKNSIKATGYFSRDAFSITSDSLYNYNNSLASLRWNHTFNDKHNGSVILSNSHYRFNIDFDGNEATNFKLGYAINETELKLQMKYLHSETHKFDYGISSKLYGVEPGSVEPGSSGSIIEPLTIPKERALESAVFVSDNFKVSDQLTLDAGVRYSIYAALGEAAQRIYEEGLPKGEETLLEVREFGSNKVIETYGNPEVRVGARYFFNPEFSVKASYNNAYQYIHSLSNNTTVSPTDTWKLSDINIRPQHARQYSLGFFKNFEDNMYELSLEGYYKRTDDILDYKVGAQLLLNEAIEQEVLQGEGKSYGVEFLLKKTKGKFNGWLGYTYSRSFVKLDGDFIEETVNNGDFFPSNYDKPHDISLVTNYKLTKRYSFSANFVYQTGRPVTVPVGNYILNDVEYVFYSDRNQLRIPDYYRLDISFNVEGNHKIKKFAHSFWNISIYNVLGKNNPYSVFFVTEAGEVKAYQSSIFSIPVPTITYNFKF